VKGFAVLTVVSVKLAGFLSVTPRGVVEKHHTTSGHVACLRDAQYCGRRSRPHTGPNLLTITFKICFIVTLAAEMFINLMSHKEIIPNTINYWGPR